MKKTLFMLLISILTISSVAAQSARKTRLVALDASSQIDAAYYNPAGTIKLNDGLHFSFTNQSIIQNQSIKNPPTETFGGANKKFKQEGSTLFLPSIQGVSKKGNWAFSANIGFDDINKLKYDGLPSIENEIASLVPFINQVAPALTSVMPGASLSAKGYSFSSENKANSHIFKVQLGGAYKINELFSVYVGLRYSRIQKKYQGEFSNLKLDLDNAGLSVIGIADNNGYVDPSPLFNLITSSPSFPIQSQNALGVFSKMTTQDGAGFNTTQTGSGLSPIIGAHFSYNGLEIGAKYEFKTSINLNNNTSIDDFGFFTDGVRNRNDIPALFSIGLSYLILPKLTANIGFHYYFDKDASLANNKQRELTGNTRDYLAGFEYRINDKFLVSVGGQIERHSINESYQTDLDFVVNSYLFGLGGAMNISKDIQVNIGYSYLNGSMNDLLSKQESTISAGINLSF